MARNISVLSLTPCAITPRCFLPIVLTKGHFSSWLLTQNGELCNEAEEMTPEDFEAAMRQQLRLFVQVRVLKNTSVHIKAVCAYARALHQWSLGEPIQPPNAQRRQCARKGSLLARSPPLRPLGAGGRTGRLNR